MFDSLLSRSANNYHGNPAINKRCMEESAIVEAWAADALAEVSPDDFTEWRSVADAYAEGQKSGACQVLRQLTPDEQAALKRTLFKSAKEL